MSYNVTLTRRQLCDLELLLNHAFSPLDGFLGRADYEEVIAHCRLKSGEIWPMPIVLDLPLDKAENLVPGEVIHLQNEEGYLLATMTLNDIWQPDKLVEAQAIYGTCDPHHPGVDYLLNQTHPVYVGGRVVATQLIQHLDFPDMYLSPQQTVALFKENAIERVVAFQTRNPIHRAHFELTLRAAKSVDAHLFIHPSVGQTKPGDVDHVTRVQCYQLMMNHYPKNNTTLSLLPLAMRMAGPREALWHALIRKNYGCTHFIIGRDHAGPGKNKQGQDYYAPYAAQEFVSQYTKDMAINILPMEEIHYVKTKQSYLMQTEINADPSISPNDICTLSGSELRHLLNTKQAIPSWFSYPEIIAQLQNISVPKEGFTLFFTGLPSSGKSTLATALSYRLSGLTNRQISLLDGDVFRQFFSSQLGFTKKDRDDNVKRVGFIASEITKHQGIAICALIAPYAEARQWVREQVNQYGSFIEIYVSTSLATCEARDPKGLYKKARAKTISHFTGIDDPYIAPTRPELVIDTTGKSINVCVEYIITQLQMRGLICTNAPSPVQVL